MDKNKKMKEKGKASKVFIIICFTVLILYSISLLFPLAWGFMTSLKSGLDFNMYSGVLGLPQTEYSSAEMKFGNYVEVFKGMNFTKQVNFYAFFSSDISPVEHYREINIFTMLINTLLLSTISAGLPTLISFIMAYVCAKYKYKFSTFIYTMFVVTMTLPIVGTGAAMIKFMQTIGLFDTYMGFIIQNFHGGGMYYLVFFGLCVAMGDSYSEAAEIDGAGQYRILFSVIIPLQIKVIMTVFLIQFVNAWNNYQSFMIHMPTHATLAYGVYRLTVETNKGIFAEAPGRLTACMMLALPILVVFILFKDKIMGNVTIGGIKG